MLTKLTAGALVAVAALAFSAPPAAAAGCPVKDTIKFSGLDWASNHFHVAVASYMVEKGWGCKSESIPTTTAPSLNALAKGDLHISMEIWYANNREIWDKMKATGKVMEPGGVSITGAVQGFYVPRYLIEGDKKRGIKAAAPGLKSVADLAKYTKLFEDPEEPSKGRFYNCKIGWNCERVNTKKMQAYGLDKTFTNFRPGTGEALAAAIASAYKRGKPVVAYYWGPTWLLGKYDMVMLKEPEYNEEIWKKLDKAKSGKGMMATAYPTIKVIIGLNKKFAAAAGPITQMLSKYNLDTDTVNKALVFMNENKDKTGAKTAADFLKNNQTIWTKWVPADVAAKIKASL